MSQAAFALKAGLDLDSVGAIYVHDGVQHADGSVTPGDFDIREALVAGDGFIVTDDGALIARLDAYEQLKRTTLQAVDEARTARGREKSKAAGAAKSTNEEG